MYKKTAAGYQGADWVKKALRPKEMSEFGEKIADLLGDLFSGIYHADDAALKKIDWGNKGHIEFKFHGNLATYDSKMLTNLVLMAHQRAIRVQISPSSNRYLKILFHPRKSGMEHDWFERHPTIEEAISDFNKHYPME